MKSSKQRHLTARSSRRALFGVIAALSLACAACAPRATEHRTPTGASSEAARSLHALFVEEWEHDVLESPVWASSIGDPRGADRWDDVGFEARARREAHDREVLAKLGHIPRRELSREDALNYDLFRHKYEEAATRAPFHLHLLALSQQNGIQTIDDLADAMPFETVKHFEDWNRRLESFPRYMDQTIVLLAEGARTGMTHPKIAMVRVVAQIDKQIVQDPAKSPFYAPYIKSKAKIPDAERARLSAEAKRAITTAIVPAFEKLRAFFVGTYLPACRDEVGAWKLPNGRALYAHLVRSHTTTTLTPDEVHAIGLREVARIRVEMDRAKAKAGFSGSLKDFFVFLRTDRRFFYPDSAALLAGYRELTKKIDPLLGKLFKHLPRTPYDVAAIPEHVAPDAPTAYYRPLSEDGSRPGTFFVNLYKPESRPIWEMPALTMHEAVPGHHLQIALAMEQKSLPAFRRHADYNAFLEGWALYAESLGDLLGLYDDPYAKMGQLTYEMWRAVRLVVDTGIHHLAWDRQRAIDFFMENAPKSELDIVNEIDRYIVWPGQALAYKLGALKIEELKKKKRAALGARFDLRDFHDAVLRSGPLPLDVLERQVMSAD